MEDVEPTCDERLHASDTNGESDIEYATVCEHEGELEGIHMDMEEKINDYIWKRRGVEDAEPTCD